MRALVFDKSLRYRSDYPLPGRTRNEAFIKVILAGICNTDLEISKGYMGFSGIPGHEFVGIVEKCARKDLIGRRVVSEINIGCGRCFYCRNRLKNHCPHRSVLGILNRNGVFADYVTVPVNNLHAIPDSISNEEAVFVEPLAAAFEIPEQVNVRSSDRVCILGDGKLGLLVAQVLSKTRCDLLVVGKHSEKLSILKDLDIRTKLKSSLREKGFDIAIDCTGSNSGINTALEIVRPKGRIILKTTLARNTAIDSNAIVIKEMTVIGSRCGPFEPAVKAIKAGAIQTLPLISNKLRLKDGVRAFKLASKKGVLKVLLEVNT